MTFGVNLIQASALTRISLPPRRFVATVGVACWLALHAGTVQATAETKPTATACRQTSAQTTAKPEPHRRWRHLSFGQTFKALVAAAGQAAQDLAPQRVGYGLERERALGRVAPTVPLTPTVADVTPGKVRGPPTR